MRELMKIILKVIGAVMVVGVVAYFFVPTTDYYRLDYMTDLDTALGHGHKPVHVEISEVEDEGSWEFTYEELQDVVFDEEETEKPTTDVHLRLLVAITHIRAYSLHNLLKDLTKISRLRDIIDLREKYDIEIDANIV